MAASTLSSDIKHRRTAAEKRPHAQRLLNRRKPHGNQGRRGFVGERVGVGSPRRNSYETYACGGGGSFPARNAVCYRSTDANSAGNAAGRNTSDAAGHATRNAANEPAEPGRPSNTCNAGDASNGNNANHASDPSHTRDAVV
jgi:hypothetical protein